MYTASFSSRFARDVKVCEKRHWNLGALEKAMRDLMASDVAELDRRYKDHALKPPFDGYRSIHVDSAPNSPRDKWVLMYRINAAEIVFARTGTHAEVYGLK